MNYLIVGIYIFILFFSGVVITKAIRIFINSSTKLAHILGISEYTISFLLIATATSLPELVVSITSGLEKNSILSYGNAIGSNLALLTVISVIPVFLNSGLSTKDVVRSKDLYVGAFFLVLSLALSVDGIVTRFDGGILLTAFFIYSRSVVKRATVFENIKERLKIEHINVWKEGVYFFGSLFLLLAASEGIVQSAFRLSSLMGLNLGYIGLTLTALGTSLPEIAFAIGIVKGHGNEDEVVGDVIGSVVANSSLVLGTAALIWPINLNHSTLGLPTMGILIATLMMYILFARSDERINRLEASMLLGVYFLFLAIEFILIST